MFSEDECHRRHRHLQKCAFPLLGLLDFLALVVRLGLVTLVLDLDDSVDGQFEYFLNPSSLLGTTLHVCRPHLFGHRSALLGSDGSESLAPEQLDTGPLGPQIGL